MASGTTRAFTTWTRSCQWGTGLEVRRPHNSGFGRQNDCVNTLAKALFSTTNGSRIQASPSSQPNLCNPIHCFHVSHLAIEFESQIRLRPSQDPFSDRGGFRIGSSIRHAFRPSQMRQTAHLSWAFKFRPQCGPFSTRHWAASLVDAGSRSQKRFSGRPNFELAIPEAFPI